MKATKPSVGALILAAGQSRRMGAHNKLLMTWRDVTLVRHVVLQALASEVSAVCVVTGFEAAQITTELSDLPVTFVHNPAYEQGLASSLQRGLQSLDESMSGALVCLADMPLVCSQDMNLLLRAFRHQPSRPICVPKFQGRRGNPIVIPRQWFDDLLHTQGDQGARGLIQRHPEYVHWVEMPTASVLLDVDTPAAFAQLAQR